MSGTLELTDQMRKHMRKCRLHDNPITVMVDEHLQALVMYMAFSCGDVSKEEMAAIFAMCAAATKPYVLSLSGNTLACTPLHAATAVETHAG